MAEKRTYKFVCPACGTENEMELTPLMEAGSSTDYVSCWNCNAYLHIELTDQGRIVATSYDEHTRKVMRDILDDILCLL